MDNIKGSKGAYKCDSGPVNSYLNRVLISLHYGQEDKVSSELEQLGIPLYDNEGIARSFTDVFNDIRDIQNKVKGI